MNWLDNSRQISVTVSGQWPKAAYRELDDETNQRDALQQWLNETPQSLHQEGGIQRFAAALLFSPPGAVRLADPDSNLPAWFAEGFKRYCSMAQG